MSKQVRVPEWDGVERLGHSGWMLQKYHNLYKGEKVFIIGTGPSLGKVPTSQLEDLCNEYTFGVNLVCKTNLPFITTMLALTISEWHWVNDKGLDWMVETIKGTGKVLPPLLFYGHEKQVPWLDEKGWQYVRCSEGQLVDAVHPDKGAVYFQGLGGYLRYVGFGYSVVLTAIQLACWMGFDPIYLLGCDATGKGHAYEEDPELDAREADQSGFHTCAKLAEGEMKKLGRKLVDLTEGGTLPVTKGSLGRVLSARS